MTQTTTRKPRRMAREKQPQPQEPSQEKSFAAGDNPASAVKTPSRLDQLQALLTRPDGATIAEMVEATGERIRDKIAASKAKGLWMPEPGHGASAPSS